LLCCVQVLEALWPGGAVIVYGNPSLSLNMKVLFRISPFCHLQVLEALRPGGAVTVFGSLSGPGLDIQVSQLFGKSVNSFIIYQWCAPRIPYYINSSRQSTLNHCSQLH